MAFGLLCDDFNASVPGLAKPRLMLEAIGRMLNDAHALMENCLLENEEARIEGKTEPWPLTSICIFDVEED